jgi:hypothetical protein
MGETETRGTQANPPAAGRAHWLVPETTHIFEGTFSLLHCHVKGEPPYRGVFAVKLFPVSHPNRYISLLHTDLNDKTQEIGVIEELGGFPEEEQSLIRISLGKQYYEQIITGVQDVEAQHDLLFLEVETQRGREEFVMRWRQDRAEDYGDRGKVLLDVFENRYIIPDVAVLPSADQRRLRKYIYW